MITVPIWRGKGHHPHNWSQFRQQVELDQSGNSGRFTRMLLSAYDNVKGKTMSLNVKSGSKVLVTAEWTKIIKNQSHWVGTWQNWIIQVIIIQPFNIFWVGGFKETWMGMHCSTPILKKETMLALTLVELLVFVLKNLFNSIKLPQNSMKLLPGLPNHMMFWYKVLYKPISYIIVSD